MLLISPQKLKKLHQSTIPSYMKAEYFRLAKEVAADYALLRGTMHKKGVDIGLTPKVLGP